MSFDREAAAADREASGVDSRAADPRGPSLRWLAWVGLVALLALYLGRIGGFALQDPDEGRYAEIPREMIELNDWVTPRLDYVRYFEKPPLLYWLVGMSYQAFGMTEASARLAPALAGIATVVATWALGRAMFGPRQGLLAAAEKPSPSIEAGMHSVHSLTDRASAELQADGIQVGMFLRDIGRMLGLD